MAKQITDPRTTPTHEQIAARAYQIFVERGQPQGRDLDHWLEAEAQLRAAGQAGGSTGIEATHGNSRSQSSTRSATRARK